MQASLSLISYVVMGLTISCGAVPISDPAAVLSGSALAAAAPPERVLTGSFHSAAGSRSWTFTLVEDGAYVGTTGSHVESHREVGCWAVRDSRLHFTGDGVLATFAGEEGFLIGGTKGRPTLTSEANGMTFSPLVLAAHDVSDLVQPQREYPYPPSVKGQPDGEISDPVTQTDGGFADTADHPNRSTDED